MKIKLILITLIMIILILPVLNLVQAYDTYQVSGNMIINYPNIQNPNFFLCDNNASKQNTFAYNIGLSSILSYGSQINLSNLKYSFSGLTFNQKGYSIAQSADISLLNLGIKSTIFWSDTNLKIPFGNHSINFTKGSINQYIEIDGWKFGTQMELVQKIQLYHNKELSFINYNMSSSQFQNLNTTHISLFNAQNNFTNGNNSIISILNITIPNIALSENKNVNMTIYIEPDPNGMIIKYNIASYNTSSIMIINTNFFASLKFPSSSINQLSNFTTISSSVKTECDFPKTLNNTSSGYGFIPSINLNVPYYTSFIPVLFLCYLNRKKNS